MSDNLQSAAQNDTTAQSSIANYSSAMNASKSQGYSSIGESVHQLIPHMLDASSETATTTAGINSQTFAHVDAAESLQQPVSEHDQLPIQLHNATIPIHSLPAELLIEVLLLTMDFTIMCSRLLPHLHTLAQVCARWHATVISSPQLWWLLGDLETKTARQIILRKNPQGLLIVRITQPFKDKTEFIRLARERAYQWEKLLVNLYAPSALGLLDVHAPRLKTLAAVIDQRSSGVASLIPLQSAPLLEQLHLTGACLPWDTILLPKIRFLDLSFQLSFPISRNQLTVILLASPNLEWLGLRHLHDRDESGSIPARPLPLPLLALQGLSVSLGLLPWYFANNIDSPNCHAVQLQIDFQDIQPNISMLSKLFKLPMERKDICITAKQCKDDFFDLYITAGSWPVDLIAHWESFGSIYAGCAIDISVMDVPIGPDQWHFLGEALGVPVGRAELTLWLFNNNERGHVFDTDDAPWKDMLVCIIIPFTDVVPMLRYVSQSCVEDGATTWPCPRLRQIQFECPPDELCKAEESLEEVWDAIRDFRRWEGGRIGNRVRMGPEPAPFETSVVNFRGRQWEVSRVWAFKTLVQLGLIDGE